MCAYSVSISCVAERAWLVFFFINFVVYTIFTNAFSVFCGFILPQEVLTVLYVLCTSVLCSLCHNVILRSSVRHHDTICVSFTYMIIIYTLHIYCSVYMKAWQELNSSRQNISSLRSLEKLFVQSPSRRIDTREHSRRESTRTGRSSKTYGHIPGICIDLFH